MTLFRENSHYPYDSEMRWIGIKSLIDPVRYRSVFEKWLWPIVHFLCEPPSVKREGWRCWDDQEWLDFYRSRAACASFFTHPQIFYRSAQQIPMIFEALPFYGKISKRLQYKPSNTDSLEWCNHHPFFHIITIILPNVVRHTLSL